MTWREFELRKQAYDRIQYNDWSKFRIHAWKTISVHIDPKKSAGFSLYEWFPIPGDPSASEIKKMNEERRKQEAEEAKRINKERLEAMRKAGYDV